MNNSDSKYTKYHLVKEMFETVDIISNYDTSSVNKINPWCGQPVFFTGEGSSRRFSVKGVMHKIMQSNGQIVNEAGGSEALDYDLNGYAVLGLTNSGKTLELVRLFETLNQKNVHPLISITAHDNTPITKLSDHSYILKCGKEEAVAATKSVVEQALLLDTLFLEDFTEKNCSLKDMAQKFESMLTMNIDPKILDILTKAKTIYLVGKNNGVAEELSIKTGEITRKKSMFLEGTLILHGYEEIMLENEEAIIFIEPSECDFDAFYKRFTKKVAIPSFAISSIDTPFPTIKIPHACKFTSPYLQLAAGWNLLVDIGLALNIDIDKPIRAQKIGNEL